MPKFMDALSSRLPKMPEYHPSPRAQKCLAGLKTNLLLLLTMLSIIVGLAVGLGARTAGVQLTKRQIMYIGFPGEIFQRCLMMVVLPLIISSLVSSAANLDLGSSRLLGLRSMIYYLITTVLAVIMGIILVLAIRPGVIGSYKDTINKTAAQIVDADAGDTVLDLIRNIFPNNLVEATFSQYGTDYKHTIKTVNTTNGTRIVDTTDAIAAKHDGTNVLGLITFCLCLGAIISSMGEQGKPLNDFFSCLNECIMKLVNIVMWYSPIGICFLIIRKFLEMENLAEVMAQLGLYVATVLTGLAIHGFIVLPLIMLIVARRNPFKYLYNMAQAMLTAFGTASSSATLPVTLRCLEENNKVDPRVTRFMVPIGATVNMDGTALYEAVACIFIAQATGRADELGIGGIIIVSLTATLASIGAAGIPSAGLMTLVMVLTAVNLPPDVSLIITVDWFLDRFRTMINVWGDCIGAGVVQHLSRFDLGLASQQPTEPTEIVPTSELSVQNGGIHNEGYHESSGL